MPGRKIRSRQGRPGRGVLLVLTFLFVGSGVLRMIGGTGEAIAREVAAARSDQPSAETPPQMSTENLAAMLAAFQEREESLASRERALEERLRALETAEAAVRAQMQDLVEAEARLRDTLALADGASENDVARLTSVFENMKPKEAAKLFEEMDPQFAAGFIARMRPDAAAGIMAGLSPNAAYSISVVMAGRHAQVPRE